MADLANVAATLMEHLCTHNWHGYTQGGGRWGDGEGVCSVTVEGKTYSVEQGDRDCSSAVIDCWKQALKGTSYEGALDAAPTPVTCAPCSWRAACSNGSP